MKTLNLLPAPTKTRFCYKAESSEASEVTAPAETGNTETVANPTQTAQTGATELSEKLAGPNVPPVASTAVSEAVAIDTTQDEADIRNVLGSTPAAPEQTGTQTPEARAEAIRLEGLNIQADEHLENDENRERINRQIQDRAETGADRSALPDSEQAAYVERHLNRSPDQLAQAMEGVRQAINAGEVIADLIGRLLQELGFGQEESAQIASTHGRNLQGTANRAGNAPGRNPTESERVSAQQAARRLRGAGISIVSTAAGANEDGTSRASNRTCLIGLRENSIDGALAIKSAMNGPLTITGGTENNHAAGTYSHANGYKLDFKTTTATKRFFGQQAGFSGDFPFGTSRTVNVNGHSMKVYRHAPDHFDVRFNGRA